MSFKKNILRSWLLNGIVFIFMLASFDFVMGHLLQHYYFKMKSGTQYRATYAIEKTTAEIVIFGSSRAMEQYHPFVFKDRYKLTYYNAGRNGESGIFYHYAVLKSILKRYIPKVVILDFMIDELNLSGDSYDKLASLAPYYNTHPEMRPIIELRSSTEKIKMLSGIYPFNSTIMNIISGNLDLDDQTLIDGYYPIPSSYKITRPIANDDRTKPYKIDTVKLNMLGLFIKDCNQAGIKLHIVCSPVYTRFIGTDYSILTAKKMADSLHTNFFDFSKDSFFLSRPTLFFNEIHLNDSGAKFFSTRLIDKIDLAEKGRPVQK